MSENTYGSDSHANVDVDGLDGRVAGAENNE